MSGKSAFSMLARLEQVLEINSTSVVVGKNKYDLEKVMRNEKNEVRRMELVVKSFMKSSIAGNIKLADVQDDDQEETPVKKMKVKSTKAVKKDPVKKIRSLNQL